MMQQTIAKHLMNRVMYGLNDRPVRSGDDRTDMRPQQLITARTTGRTLASASSGRRTARVATGRTRYRARRRK